MDMEKHRVRAEVFAELEAKLRLEGTEPFEVHYELRERILAGELDVEEAEYILKAHYPSNPPDAEDWEILFQGDRLAYYEFMEGLDPKFRELARSDPYGAEYYRRLGELETVENYVALNRWLEERAASRRAKLGGTG